MLTEKDQSPHLPLPPQSQVHVNVFQASLQGHIVYHP